MKHPAISKGMKAAQRRGTTIGRPASAENTRRIEKLRGCHTAPEISRLTGIPQSTVYSILSRLNLKEAKS